MFTYDEKKFFAPKPHEHECDPCMDHHNFSIPEKIEHHSRELAHILQHLNKIFCQMQMGCGKLQMILLLRVCDRAADEKHAPQKRCCTAFFLQILHQNTQICLCAGMPERRDHLGTSVFAGNFQHKRTGIFTVQFGTHFCINTGRNGSRLCHTAGNRTVFANHVGLPQ